ncbi:ArsO family NAD(P)H-dependent flavin-containing monooxygenase [Arenibacter certesii]|uniref:Monooxygenase n=1 Tax=Arenibacter certesii TaxID=228955 RepID=A0A918J4T2_9FLAO|nr:ArsO family NAD(P)H-dependent flavin-containing monooxygenase [Arenibacter certesii]GGW44366.1 monooxygenase [Arenibacter certesii]
MIIYDTIIIGGGQAGISVAYFLRRSALEYLILDNQDKPGGAWLQTWESLQLFSPSQYSSLSGWQMPKTKEEYPTKAEFINYLTAYEERYSFPIKRSTEVLRVEKENGLFKIITSKGVYKAKTVVSTTGTAKNPYIPNYPDQNNFKGVQLHSAEYSDPKSFQGKKVLVVGGGNSGAQILSELSKVAKTKWVTKKVPQFMPEEIDGRYLFVKANSSYLDNNTHNFEEEVSLSDIVQVDSVKEGLKRGIYNAVRPFLSFYEDGVIWQDGEKEAFHAVIWCTGFRANLYHLQPLNIVKDNRVITKNTRSLKEPNLWLVGYGSWTGFASATIYGVGKTARATASEIQAYFELTS